LTYCLGILLPEGLVLAADSRSNAGIDQIARVHKLAVFEKAGNRVICILSAGNLATTQAVVTALREALGSGDYAHDLETAETMFEAARILGAKLRQVLEHETRYVEPYGDPSASFLIGGQIAGERPRLFEVYSAGNFIEASDRACFLQIGETKYGRPILDRALHRHTPLEEAAKLALLSFDATMRSNLSVGLPIDILRYDIDSFSARNFSTLEAHNPYWQALRQKYSEGLAGVIAGLPAPPPLCGREDESRC
jgi:putative proteasome-type protease